MASKKDQKLKQTEFINKLLIKCKTWSGPCASREELLSIIKKHPDNEKIIVNTELAYYVHTHPAEKAFHPELFRQTMIPMEEKVSNLCMLLSNDDGNSVAGTATVLDLPSVEDAIVVLGGQVENIELYSLNNLCVSMWIEDTTANWYIGYFKRQVSSGRYEVEQLLRKEKSNSIHWMHPETPILETIDQAQILSTKRGKLLAPVGEWSFGRNNTFLLKNADSIKKEFDAAKHILFTN